MLRAINVLFACAFYSIGQRIAAILYLTGPACFLYELDGAKIIPSLGSGPRQLALDAKE